MLNLINQSLEIGVFPTTWKESCIIPIQKKTGTIKCEEHRPINTLPSLEKLIEYKVKNQLQSGFRRAHSCETALNLVTSDWQEAREKGYSIVLLVIVFLDLKRAFETLDRGLLLTKLKYYGIRNIEYKWFESYLTDRKQTTKYGNIVSSPEFTSLGVPQGSILGPILFIIYINDIINAIKYSNISLFADDTILYCAGNNLNEVIEKINKDLESINKRLNFNKSKLNIEKTLFMIINDSKVKNKNVKCEVKINNINLKKERQNILES